MAVTANDRAKARTNGALDYRAVKGINGVNGMNGMNGMNGANGHTVAPRRATPPPKRRGFLAWCFSVAARLFTWYAILTLLFRCPATLDDCTDASPRICKPYFQVKQAVSPHVVPYYETYAAPYVDCARPYYDTFDRVVLTPGRTYAVKYGGPRVAQAQAYGQAQWEKSVQPQVAKYRILAQAHYDQSVAPHVEKAAVTLTPYYDIARTNAQQTYHDMLLPAYQVVQPYATRGYQVAHTVTTDTVIPSSIWAWNKTHAFLDSTVWPHMRDVYMLKVEPQLVRIGERLGRYKGKTLKTNTDDAEPSAPKSTFLKPSSSTSSSMSVSTADSTVKPQSSSALAKEAEPAESIVVEKADPNNSPEERKAARERAAQTVAEDLELWEGKFAQAIEEGSAEVEERVDEIAARMIMRNAGAMGKSLVDKLKGTVETELTNLKKTIIAILEAHPGDVAKCDEEVAAAIRSVGLKIKERAQAIRDWRQSYEQETEIAVTQAAQEHFSIIQKTRDLALQKIGMKWAWMDGITYKHWKQYHELKDRFASWTNEFKGLITTHPALLSAQSAGTDLEDKGMAIAQAAAEELVRLKQVASWKAAAGDFSDDFDSDTMRHAAEAAGKKMAEAAEDATASVESVGEAASNSASSVVSSVASDSDKSQSPAVDVEDHETSALPPMESLATEPTESASNLVQESAAAGSSSSDANAASASTATESMISPAPEEPGQLEETIVESEDLPTHSVKDTASTTVKSAMFGAAAQSVPSRQPILDDDFSSSVSSAASVVQDVPASITSAAQSAYTEAIAGAANQYSRAMAAASAQIHGEPKPAHEEALSSVSAAYFNAMASANSQLNAAMTSASQGIYGTPTTKWVPDMPTMPSLEWEKVQSIAQQNLQDSINWASEQYEAAKVAVGAAEPTPSTYLEGAEKRAEKLLDQAKHNYYAGVGIAHARYSEFVSSASTAMSSLTATPTPTNIQESASSAASVAGESASSVASAASVAAESMVESVGDMASDVKDAAGENWEFLVSRISSQVYGAPTPTPWYQNLYDTAGDYVSAAGEYAASATDAAGEYAASATDAAADQMSNVNAAAGDYGASATDAAASHYSVVSSLVSELVMGKEPPFTESVYSRLAGAYATGISSASSAASAASATAASAAGGATNVASSAVDDAAAAASSAAGKIKDTVDHLRDEL
ncbi:hypothetical protein F4780DRAFT_765860 [Xylariomycetidae sp. FL0641]|nr:hypothetical protein F4780DRAFT_765860 [Xylariomycetidae sp. FL0641]